MMYSGLRSCAMAGIMAGVMVSLFGATGAMAQGGNSIAGVPCEVTYGEGNFENGKPNYRASAERATFAFLAPMKAVGEGTMLYSTELGGATAEGVAAIKGAVIRDGDGGLAIEALQLALPFTVLTVNGQYQNVIQMAHEQGVPAALEILSDGASMGGIALQQGAFDPNVPVVAFDAESAVPIHAALMRDTPLVFNLDIGGQTFSAVSPKPGAYGEFVSETLAEAMEKARRLDAEEPCTFVDSDSFLELLGL